ncbi:MAG: glycosyltransferase family 39 protein [Verrucomicrobia bacterium]|nr:glycosyltransferase family 39 protein [Verrucomicrobiota bacterium]
MTARCLSISGRAPAAEDRPENCTPVLLVASAWLLTLLLTWGIAENSLFDFATFLHSATRLAGGDIVYRDFQWMYPPLSLWIYGTLARFTNGAYLAFIGLSAIVSLLQILAAYHVCRLFLRPRTSSLCAVSAYLCVFLTTSTAGTNFTTIGFTHTGFVLFTWMIVVLGLAIKYQRNLLRFSAVAGSLAGLCLLNKHEQIAGVAAVSVFLLVRRVILGEKDIDLLSFFATMLAIAGAGYWHVIQTSGWEYFWSAFQAYGTAAEHATRNLPSLMTIWKQILIFLLHAGAFVCLATIVGGVHMTITPSRNRQALLIFGVTLILLAAIGFIIEALRVYGMAVETDWRTAADIPASLALYGMLSRESGMLQSTLNYIGELLIKNLAPMFLLLAVMGIGWLKLLHRRLKREKKPLSRRLQIAGLLLFGSAGLQARAQFSYSDFGTFAMALPLLLLLSPYCAARFVGTRHTARTVRRFRGAYAKVWLVASALAALSIYSYEFGWARILPLKVDAEHGTILLPRTDEHKALAGAIALTRKIGDDTVICLPYEGIQYWTGGSTPFSWTALVTPSIYHPPWSDNLTEGLKQHPATYIVFDRLDEAAVTFPSHEVDWYDGPHYKPYRWKEAFPEIWKHVIDNAVLVESFGPTNAPYFSVYRYAGD